jgi:hypothetical protein
MTNPKATADTKARVWQRQLRLEVGEAFAVVEHESEEFAGRPVAGNVALGIGDGAEEPAEVEAVGPDGDVYLIATEEGNGGADTVNGGAVGEVAFEIEAEAFLGSTANGNDDVAWAEPVESFEQSGIGDGAVTVHWGHIDEVFGDANSVPCEKGEIALGAAGAGHDPEGVAGLADFGFEEKFAKVLQPGEALDRGGLETIPDEDHEGRVGDGEVGVEERFAIVEVAVEVFESGSGGDDEEATITHELDGFRGGPVEEVDTEDAVAWGGNRLGDHV